jgi:hypothetical protein
MTKSELREPPIETPQWPAPEAPADVLARGWIGALRQMHPQFGELADDRGGGFCVAEHWTIETLLKLGFTAPDRAYEVGVRIVELSDDPWILDSVRVSVFEDLVRRDPSHFTARLSADASRLPGLRHTLRRIAPGGVGRAKGARLSRART